jgi:hypothetical protein
MRFLDGARQMVSISGFGLREDLSELRLCFRASGKITGD